MSSVDDSKVIIVAWRGKLALMMKEVSIGHISSYMEGNAVHPLTPPSNYRSKGHLVIMFTSVFFPINVMFQTCSSHSS